MAATKCFIMTYHLPVTLSRAPDGTWRAAWVADNITARTPNSIGQDNAVIWMGVVSRACMDAATLAHLAAAGAAPSDASAPLPPPPPPPGAPPGCLRGADAGGLGALGWEQLCPRLAAAYAPSEGAGGGPRGFSLEGSGGCDPVSGAPLRIGDPAPALSAADKAGIAAALNPLSVLPSFLPPLLHEG